MDMSKAIETTTINAAMGVYILGVFTRLLEDITAMRKSELRSELEEIREEFAEMIGEAPTDLDEDEDEDEDLDEDEDED